MSDALTQVHDDADVYKHVNMLPFWLSASLATVLHRVEADLYECCHHQILPDLIRKIMLYVSWVEPAMRLEWQLLDPRTAYEMPFQYQHFIVDGSKCTSQTHRASATSVVPRYHMRHAPELVSNVTSASNEVQLESKACCGLPAGCVNTRLCVLYPSTGWSLTLPRHVQALPIVNGWPTTPPSLAVFDDDDRVPMSENKMGQMENEPLNCGSVAQVHMGTTSGDETSTQYNASNEETLNCGNCGVVDDVKHVDVPDLICHTCQAVQKTDYKANETRIIHVDQITALAVQHVGTGEKGKRQLLRVLCLDTPRDQWTMMLPNEIGSSLLYYSG